MLLSIFTRTSAETALSWLDNAFGELRSIDIDISFSENTPEDSIWRMHGPNVAGKYLRKEIKPVTKTQHNAHWYKPGCVYRLWFKILKGNLFMRVNAFDLLEGKVILINNEPLGENETWVGRYTGPHAKRPTCPAGNLIWEGIDRNTLKLDDKQDVVIKPPYCNGTDTLMMIRDWNKTDAVKCNDDNVDVTLTLHCGDESPTPDEAAESRSERPKGVPEREEWKRCLCLLGLIPLIMGVLVCSSWFRPSSPAKRRAELEATARQTSRTSRSSVEADVENQAGDSEEENCRDSVEESWRDSAEES